MTTSGLVTPPVKTEALRDLRGKVHIARIRHCFSGSLTQPLGRTRVHLKHLVCQGTVLPWLMGWSVSEGIWKRHVDVYNSVSAHP